MLVIGVDATCQETLLVGEDAIIAQINKVLRIYDPDVEIQSGFLLDAFREYPYCEPHWVSFIESFALLPSYSLTFRRLHIRKLGRYAVLLNNPWAFLLYAQQVFAFFYDSRSEQEFAATEVLADVSLPDNEKQGAIQELADALAHELSRLKPRIYQLIRAAKNQNAPDQSSYIEPKYYPFFVPLPRSRGLMALDVLLIETLDSLGPHSRSFVEDHVGQMEARDQNDSMTLEETFERWTLEKESPALFIDILTRCLWYDRVGPQRVFWQKEGPPALVRGVYEQITRLLSPPGANLSALVDSCAMPALAPDRNHQAVSTDQAEPTEQTVGSGLRTIHAHKLIRYLVTEADKHPSSNVGPCLLSFGGYDALAYLLKIRSAGVTNQLPAILESLRSVAVTVGSVSHRLIDVQLDKTHRPPRLVVRVGDILRRGYVHSLPKEKSRSARRARDLIPVCSLPPLYGRFNEHCAQATLALLVVQRLRDLAEQLDSQKGIPITREEFATMAETAGLPRENASAVLEAWLQGGKDGTPPFLKKDARGRYTLGDHHANARALLERGGQRSAEQRNNGRLSVQERDDAITKRKKRRPRRQPR